MLSSGSGCSETVRLGRNAMPSANSENPAKGRAFQELAREVLSEHFGVQLSIDAPMGIGDPEKNHNFDLASADRSCVGECKCYGWTETGNMPSAKMAFVNEAVLYLSLLPSQTKRFVVMRKDSHPKRSETLAEYYYRTYRHLLYGIQILELDVDARKVRLLG